MLFFFASNCKTRRIGHFSKLFLFSLALVVPLQSLLCWYHSYAGHHSRQEKASNELDHKNTLLQWIKAPINYQVADKSDVLLPKTKHEVSPSMTIPLMFQNLRQYVHARSPVSGPCHPSIKTLIFVLSHVDAFESRDTCRKTWASKIPHSMRVIFVVGRYFTDQKQRKQKLKHLKREFTLGDMLFVDTPDTYENLVFKSQAFYHWRRTFCPKTEFVVKVDSDTVINLANLQFWIDYKFRSMVNQAPMRRACFGDLIANRSVIRTPNHRWFTPYGTYSAQSWPVYANGPIYMFTGELASAIIDPHVTAKVKLNPIDDAFTAILAHQVGASYFHVGEHFRTYLPLKTEEPCSEPQGHRKETHPLITAWQVPGWGQPVKLRRMHCLLHALRCERRGITGGRSEYFVKTGRYLAWASSHNCVHQ